MADFDAISSQLQIGEADDVRRLVTEALDEGTPAEEILTKGLLAGMTVIGKKFKVNELFVPDVIFAARAMTAGMELLQPILAEKGVEPVGRIVMGTVKGDLHDIGKNLVGMMLRGAGFTVVDLGSDVPAEKFVEAAKDAGGACLVGLSALLTTTMPKMAEVIQAMKDAGLGKVKIMVGGAPVTRGFADEIGADGYAPDAASAADLAKQLLSV